MTISKAVEFFNNNDNYLILTHKNPDGDTLGSSAALCSSLRRAGKTAYVYPNPGITEKFMPYIAPYLAVNDFEPECVISVDTATLEMLCTDKYSDIAFTFDHHPTNSHYARNTIVKAEYSSCGELICDFILKLKGDISKQEADLLYIAVSTDTGCFVYANVNYHTFETVSRLVKAGASNAELNQVFFRKTSRERLKLEGLVYSSLTYHLDGRLCVGMITRDMLKESGATENDMDDMASLPGRAKDCLVSMLIKELNNGSCKVSLRSSPQVNCIDICAYFGGGGHRMASGCTVAASPEKTKEMLISVIQEVMR